MKKIMKYDFLKSLIKKSPMLRRTLRPLKDIIRKDVVSPKFSGWGMTNRKSTRLNSSHVSESRMPSSA